MLYPGGAGTCAYFEYEDKDGAEGPPVPRLLIVSTQMVAIGTRTQLVTAGPTGNHFRAFDYKLTGEGLTWNGKFMPFSRSNLFIQDQGVIEQFHRVLSNSELDSIKASCPRNAKGLASLLPTE